MATHIDHLVVAAATLESGCSWLQEKLGVAPAPGGKHPEFGTHNALLSLGDAYIEVIAIDPEASATPGPRRFSLDRLKPESGPRLIHWVVAMPNLSPVNAVEVTRGSTRCRIAVPGGAPSPEPGAEPSLIDWITPSPVASLPTHGLRLTRLEVTSPNGATLLQRLGDLGLNDPRVRVEVGPVALRARIETPAGEVEL